MAKFIRLEESKAFLNLEYVTLATEPEDGSVAVNIVDQDKTQLIKDSDAINLSFPQDGGEKISVPTDKIRRLLAPRIGHSDQIFGPRSSYAPWGTQRQKERFGR